MDGSQDFDRWQKSLECPESYVSNNVEEKYKFKRVEYKKLFYALKYFQITKRIVRPAVGRFSKKR